MNHLTRKLPLLAAAVSVLMSAPALTSEQRTFEGTIKGTVRGTITDKGIIEATIADAVIEGTFREPGRSAEKGKKTISGGVKVAAAAPAAPVAGDAITVVNFGGAVNTAMKSAYFQPFQSSTGADVQVVEYNGEQAKVKAMVDSKKVVWDVVEVETGDLGRGCQEGIYEKLDVSRILDTKDYIVGSIQPCGVGVFAWSTVLAYNADVVKTPPSGWKDFWDVKKFPGKRGLRKGARYNLEFALMADGVPTTNVYKVLWTKEGIDRAFRKLDELKPHIQWWESGSQPPQMLTSGEIVMSTAYNGRIDAAQRDGKNLEIVWAGNIFDFDYWVIPRGSPNKHAAMEFIKFASSPEAQAEYAKKISYGPVSRSALGKLDLRTLAKLPTSPGNAKDAVRSNLLFWTHFGEQLEARFVSWTGK